jgi:hypothetical protein
VQNDAEFDLKCTTEADQIETGRGLLAEALDLKRRRARHVPLNARVMPQPSQKKLFIFRRFSYHSIFIYFLDMVFVRTVV